MSDKEGAPPPSPLSAGIAAMDMVHTRSSNNGDEPPLVVQEMVQTRSDGSSNGHHDVAGAKQEEVGDHDKTDGNSNGGSNGSHRRAEDSTDAWPEVFRRRPSPSPNNVVSAGNAISGAVATMPVARDSEVYNMNHRRRGVAYVFNHMHFDERLGLKQRNGTNADRDNLRLSLRALDFEVRVFNDLSFKDIERHLEECASVESHADADCILVAVLSHGEMGILYAQDHAYKPDRLWSHFTPDKCPSLAGKPKLFFIQACQGDQLDSGVHLTATDSSSSQSYKIPSRADFLIAYSTIPGFYSWRNTTAGSWFVQALCYVLQREAQTRDLLSMLTHVCRRVAFDFQSNTPGDYNMHEKKQIPCITSMLTRDVYFLRKQLP